MNTLSKTLVRLKKAACLSLILLGAASAAPAQTPPDLVVRGGFSGKTPGPADPVIVRNFWLDEAGFLTRSESYDEAKPSVLWIDTVTRDGNTLIVKEDEGGGKFSEWRIVYTGSNVEWNNPQTKEIIAVSPEPGVLWKDSRKAAWGDAEYYEELALQPDKALANPPEIWQRQGSSVSQWYQGNLNGRYVLKKTGAGYSADYQSQYDTGTPFHSFGGHEITGKLLHQVDPMINVINSVILEAMCGSVPYLLPSLWGWDLTKETK